MNLQNLLPVLLLLGGGFLVLRTMSATAQATAEQKPADTAGPQLKQPEKQPDKPKEPEKPKGETLAYNSPQTVLRQALISQGVPADIAASVSATSSDGRTYPESTVRLIYQNAAAGIPGWVRLSDVGGIRLNGWEWNYYRNEAIAQSPGDMFNDMSASRSASEYIAALHAGGLHGLGARIRRRRS